MRVSKSLPNLLSASRIVLGVVVFGALAWAARLPIGATASLAFPRGLILVAFIAFVVGALTDFFDGWLARRLDAVSAWGTILDPIGDKIAVLAAILGLMLLEPRMGLAAPGFLILVRELFVSGLREAGASRGVRFPVTQLAKWKTTLQLIALAAEMLASVLPAWVLLSRFADGLLWVAALLTLWTGAQYAMAAVRQLPAH